MPGVLDHRQVETDRLAGMRATSQFVPLLLSVAMTGVVVGQERDARPPDSDDPKGLCKEIRKRLDSPRMLWVAWGAYQAAEMKVAGVIPDLRRRLRGIEARSDKPVRPGAKDEKLPWRRVVRGRVVRGRGGAQVPQVGFQMARLAILDALVRNSARLPLTELEAALDYDTAEPVVMLAGNDVATCAPLLVEVMTARRWRNQPITRQLAGSLLARHRSPLLPMAILATAVGRLRVDLLPVDGVPEFGPQPTPQRNKLGGLRPRVRGPSRPAAKVPKGYPPIALYRLSEAIEDPAATRLTAGRRGLFFRRQMVQSLGRVKFPVVWQPVDFAELHDLWMAELLGVTADQLPFQFESSKAIRWTGADAYRRAIRRLRDLQEGAFLALINRLRIEKRIRGGEVVELLSLDIQVRDGRPVRDEVLPDIDGVTRR